MLHLLALARSLGFTCRRRAPSRYPRLDLALRAPLAAGGQALAPLFDLEGGSALPPRAAAEPAHAPAGQAAPDGWVIVPPEMDMDIRWIAVRIASEHMAPLLRPGDVALVAVGDGPRVDSVVLVRLAEAFVCLRVRRMLEGSVELVPLVPRGDLISSAILPEDSGQLVGTVRFAWCPAL